MCDDSMSSIAYGDGVVEMLTRDPVSESNYLDVTMPTVAYGGCDYGYQLTHAKQCNNDTAKADTHNAHCNKAFYIKPR